MSASGLYDGYEVNQYGMDSDRKQGYGGTSSLDQARNDAYASLGQKAPQQGGTYRAVGGGAGSTNSSKSSRTVSRVEYSGEMPTYQGVAPVEFAKVDPRKLKALQQKAAAPGIRALNEKLQGAMNISSDNPNVRRMTLREALQGYGSGLENTMAGAGAQARSEHQQELNIVNQEKQMNFQAQNQAAMAAYQAAIAKYMASATRITETESGEGTGGGAQLVRTPFGSLRWSDPTGRGSDMGSY
jgi:hypothetical protein